MMLLQKRQTGGWIREALRNVTVNAVPIVGKIRILI
jgi:hypothetical protein